VTEESYPEGTLILTRGQTNGDALHIIKTGGVKLHLHEGEEGEMLKEYGGPGDYFGALGAIMDARANLSVEALEDDGVYSCPIYKLSGVSRNELAILCLLSEELLQKTYSPEQGLLGYFTNCMNTWAKRICNQMLSGNRDSTSPCRSLIT